MSLLTRPIALLRRRGFSLIEMILAVAILSIILLGIQSATLLASRVNTVQSRAESGRLSAGRATEWLGSELRYATSIVSSSARSIEFITPDRTGDGVDDTIRYHWSGVSGQPLFRTVNGVSTTILAKTAEFDLQYIKSSQTRPTTYTESAETQLAGYDSLLNLSNFSIKDDRFIAQSFRPSSWSNATHWGVTRIVIKLARVGADGGRTRVQIRKLRSGEPSVILDESDILETSLQSNYTWRTFYFSQVPMTPLNTSLCLTLQWEKDADACMTAYGILSLTLSGAAMYTTNDGGMNWSASSLQSISYYVYGTYFTPNPAVTDYQLTSVQYTLRSDGDTATAM